MSNAISKEAQELISEEERVLEEVLTSLRQQMLDGQLRFQTESTRARELTSRMVNATRDVDRQLLASDEAVSHQLRDSKRIEVKTLEKMIERPYFARLIVEEERNGKPVRIEYKLGTAANVDCRIIDWRKAPIARLYYEYQEGDEYEEDILGQERSGTVLLRNRLGIEESVLQKVACRLGSFVRKDGQWTAQGESREGREGPAGGLKSIVSLITAEQFRMITEEATSAVLIQGIAGSGKTTVAMHRLAWLLHEDNSDLKPQEALVLVSSRALQSYIAAIVPSLSIEGIELHTVQEWFSGLGLRLGSLLPELKPLLAADRAGLPPGVERLKRSRALLSALEAQVQEDDTRIRSALLSLLQGTMPSELRAKIFDPRLRPGGVLGRLLSVARSVENEAHRMRLQPAVERAEQELAGLRRIDERLRAILHNPAKVLQYDQSKLLDRAMVDAARVHTEEARAQGKIDSADEALLLWLYQRHFGGPALGALPKAPLRHIVADEIQELSPAELELLITMVPDATQLTLVGDVGQQTNLRSQFVGWDLLQERLSAQGESAVLTSLTVSHRSTLPIMRLADHVSGGSRTVEGRRGKPPLWLKCKTENEGVRQALGWLERVVSRFPDTMVAVLCRTGAEARHVLTLLKPTFGSAVRIGDDHSFTFQDGIVVTSIAEVKGLEFPNVLIWNPNARSYPPSQETRNLLYVGITRAEEHLCLITWGPPSRLLPPITSSLIRGHELEMDEEQE